MSDFVALESSRSRRYIAPAPVAVAVFITGLLITSAVCWWQLQRIRHVTHESVVTATEKASALIQSKLQRYQYGLRGARGVLLTAGENTVTREQFRRYSETRDLLYEFPGAKAFGFVRRVSAQDEEAFVTSARRNSMPDFTIRQLTPHEGERFVVQYVEPFEQNRLAAGLDLASDISLREAAENSMRSGVAQLTGPVTLVSAADEPRQFFLFLMPVYRTWTSPADEPARMAAAYGWSFTVLNMQDVLGDSGLDPRQVMLKIEDRTTPGQTLTFYSTPVPSDAGATVDSYSLQQQFFGRSWRMTLSAYSPFVDALQITPWKTFAWGGSLSSLSLAIAAFFLCANLRRRRYLIERQKQLAAVVESSIDGIIGKTLTGVVVSWNRGAEILFGYTASEAVGHPLASLIVPENVQDEESHLLDRISSGQTVEHFQTLRHHKDGHLLDVSVSVSPVYGADGRVIGASKTVRDISAEKAAEAQVLALNATLEDQVYARTAELERAQRVLRTVLDSVPSMIGYWDRDLINHVANHAYKVWFGLDPASVPGRRIQDVLGQELYEANRLNIEGVLRGKRQKFERAIRGPDGKIRYSLTHYVPDVSDNEVKGFFVIAHDVTDLTESRIKLADAHRENNLLLQTINAQLLYSVTNAEGLIVDVNDRFCNVHGFTREELLGQDQRFLQQGIYSELFWQSVWAVLREGNVWRGEVCNRARDGSLYWFDTVIAPSVNNEGAVERYISLHIDITERRSASEELSRLHLLLDSVLNAASEVSVIAVDVGGLTTLFNSGAQRMLGYREDEVVGVCSPALFHVQHEINERSRVLSAACGQLIEGFSVFTHVPELEGAETREWTYVCKDGKHLTVSLIVTAMHDQHGAITGYLGIASDITKQQQQRRELAAARDQLILAAEAAQLGIWSWELAEDVMDWNDRMYSLYALPPSLNGNKGIYEHWRSRLHPDDLDATESSLTACIAGNGKYDPVFRVLRPDGSVRYVQAGAYVERDAEGKAVRVTGINLDITERKSVEEELLLAKDRAEQAVLVKGQFLANMSHEIRTPMNAVLGMLQLLRQASLNTRQDDYAAKAQSAARSLLGLLNDILDFSKIDAGKLGLDLHPFSLETLMRDLAVVLSGNLGDKNIELLFEMDAGLPRLVSGDQLRLQQILINLAGNATKFTQVGHVIVQIAERERRAGQITLRISVRDTGIGISASKLSHIFESFTQAESSTTRRFGGTGLGLAISKRLVELMGGELKIVSEEGRGSEFWFDIELAVSDSAPLVSAPAISTLTGHRILVVDDSVMSGEILVRTIERLGWPVSFVSGGAAAVESVSQAAQNNIPFDAVIMDWRMPDMDGVSAAALIKNDPHNAHPPVIIMVTAWGPEELMEVFDGEHAPFEAFLTKPVTPQQLFGAIQNALDGIERADDSVMSTQVYPGRRLQGMRILVVEDNALNRQIVSELLSAEGCQITLAECGLDGVDIATRSSGEFDVVIMDVQMPDIDGMEATRRIRADERFRSLPILAMTANASRADRANCLAAGMNEHVGKPIDMREVVPLLQRLAGHYVKEESHAERATDNQDELIEPLDSILLRLGGLKDVYRMALTSFSEESERLLRQLATVYPTGSARDVASILHMLRGIAATVGARALARQAGKIEAAARTALDAPARQIISTHMTATLGPLISESLTLLQQALDKEPVLQSANGQEAAHSAIAEHTVLWNRLLVMLRNGDMQSLDIIDGLEHAVKDTEEHDVALLAAQIRNLDFDGAIITLELLLKGER